MVSLWTSKTWEDSSITGGRARVGSGSPPTVRGESHQEQESHRLSRAGHVLQGLMAAADSLLCRTQASVALNQEVRRAKEAYSCVGGREAGSNQES